jgi:hypothetical protein
MDLDKIKKKREEQRRKAEAERQRAETTRQHQEQVAATNASTQKTTEAIKGGVKVLNPDLAKSNDINEVVDSINRMNVTTFMSTRGFHDMAENITRLSSEVQTLQGKLESEGLTNISDSFQALVGRLESTAKTMGKTKVSVDDSFTKALDNLQESINRIEFNPQVNVAAPTPKVVTTPVDLKPVVAALNNVENAVKNSETPDPINLDPVVNGLQSVQDSISGLRFPVPNYILPFKDASGKDIQAQLDSNGNLPISIDSVSSLNRLALSDQNTTITSSTSATTIVSAVAATYCDLLSLVLTNSSATGTEVQLFNDDGTTIRNVFYVPANDTRGIVFQTPFLQAAVNATWKLKTVTSIASLKVTAQFIKNT